MNLFQRVYNRFRNVILYGIIGCSTSVIDFSIFAFLDQCLGIHYLISNCISVLSGLIVSFHLNRAYNFKVKDKAILRFAMFLAVGIGGLMISSLILWGGIELFHLNEILVKLFSIVIASGFQFSLNKFVTFRSPNKSITVLLVSLLLLL